MFICTIRDHNCKKQNFDIYGKPTQATNRFILSYSHHPTTHNRAAFNSMVHRLLIITPSNEENYKIEIQLP